MSPITCSCSCSLSVESPYALATDSRSLHVIRTSLASRERNVFASRRGVATERFEHEHVHVHAYEHVITRGRPWAS